MPSIAPASFYLTLDNRLPCGNSYIMELTTAQVAKRLGITPQRVRQLVSTGRIKARKPSPALLLIDVKELAKVKVRKPGRPWPMKKEQKKGR